MKINQHEWDALFRSLRDKDSRRHQGTTITDLEQSVGRAEKASAAQGCYGSEQATGDDGAIEVSEFGRCGSDESELNNALSNEQRPIQDSCGTLAEVGKVGLEGEECSVGVAQASSAPRSESQQNCAGLGAEWGILPAGIQLADAKPAVQTAQMARTVGSAEESQHIAASASEDSCGVHTQGQLPPPSASVTSLSSDRGDRPLTGALGSGKAAPPAGIQDAVGVSGEGAHSGSPLLDGCAPGLDRLTVALILAQSSMLMSRTLAYVELLDTDRSRLLITKCSQHLNLVKSYAAAEGFERELAEAQLRLIAPAVQEPEPTAGDGGNFDA